MTKEEKLLELFEKFGLSVCSSFTHVNGKLEMTYTFNSSPFNIETFFDEPEVQELGYTPIEVPEIIYKLLLKKLA